MAEDRVNVLNALKTTCKLVSFYNNWNKESQNDILMFDNFYQMDEFIIQEEKKMQRICSLKNKE